MQDVINRLKQYLSDEINLDDLNTYFRENVPYSGKNWIEDVRLAADLTVEGELSSEQKEDELIDEKTFKIKLTKLLKSIN